jgi:hypothetical protein
MSQLLLFRFCNKIREVTRQARKDAMLGGKVIQCAALRHQLTVEGIYSVVNGTFRNLAEKLTSLCEWQDRRDKAMRRYMRIESLTTEVRPDSRLIQDQT